MELAGEPFLLNLSLVAITFGAVSAVVMLLRQIMGGVLSDFDVHLIASYLSGSFAVALSALMPPLMALGTDDPVVLWAIASPLAMLFQAAYLVSMIVRRRRLTGRPPTILIAEWVLQSVAIAVLLLNAVWLRSTFWFAAPLVAIMALVLWAFVRRVTSLLVKRAEGGFDPRHG